MLFTALEQHSEIHCLDEIFVPRYFEQSHIPAGKLTAGDVLDSLSCPAGKLIFGFYVLYNELFCSRYTAGLIDELLERRFRIIHLVRNNLLRRFLSHKVALSTQTWNDTDGTKPSTLQVKLGRAEILSDIKSTKEAAERIKTLFGHHLYLEVCYEDMCVDFPASFVQVCKFLEASHEDLTPRTFKQDNRSLREAIVNYDQLKLLFTLSKHKRFFDE